MNVDPIVLVVASLRDRNLAETIGGQNSQGDFWRPIHRRASQIAGKLGLG